MAIQVLSHQLVNQIAAGETVERPSSVVKELIENSLDAGAKEIHIEVEKGGIALIRIRDNGSGISKEELPLALTRHATSKISTLDDLGAIQSLGFRGEALASIGSVSRLTLISRPRDQEEAWSAYAEGRDAAIVVKPAAHPVGSTLEIRDLFYNTPARRRFLRTEKTEFNHIDEVVRRMGLARFDVTFSLKHDGKLIRKYLSVTNEKSQLRRLSAICGAAFIEQAVAISWQYEPLSLHGWVASSDSNELQYCYVNGRIVRDKLITHAVRYASEGRSHNRSFSKEAQLSYVLYMGIPPDQVDVNVHPAKHEVRFHQSRLVHDFIYQGVLNALQESHHPEQKSGLAEQIHTSEASQLMTPTAKAIENRQSAGSNHFLHPAPGASKKVFSHKAAETLVYQQLMGKPSASSVQLKEMPKEISQKVLPVSHETLEENSGLKKLALVAQAQSFGRALTLLKDKYLLVEKNGTLALVSMMEATLLLRKKQLELCVEKGAIRQPLLIPLLFRVTCLESQILCRNLPLLNQIGIDLEPNDEHVVIHAVPPPLRHQNLHVLVPALLNYLSSTTEVSLNPLLQWLACQLAEDPLQWSLAQAITLLAEVERLAPDVIKSPPSGLYIPIDLETCWRALGEA